MNCRQFRKLVSSYLDHEMESRDYQAFTLHLTKCESCQGYLKQIQVVSEGLGQLPRPPLPYDLLCRIMMAFDELPQERRTRALRWAVNWAFMHSRFVSTVASFLITILCYGGILGQMKPIPYLPAFSQPELIKLSSLQYDRVNGRIGSTPGPEFYTFPRVQKGGQIQPSLTSLNRTPIVVVALVRPDGRASLVEVLEPRSTPQLVEQVQSALESLRFSPATSGGRPVPTQLVLMMESIDVRG